MRHNIASNTTFQPLGRVPLHDFQIALETQTSTKQDNPIALSRPAAVSLNESGLFQSGAFLASPFPGTRTDLLLIFDNALALKNKAASYGYYYYYWNGAWRRTDRPFSEDRGTDLAFTLGLGVIIRKETNATATTAIWLNAPNY